MHFVDVVCTRQHETRHHPRPLPPHAAALPPLPRVPLVPLPGPLPDVNLGAVYRTPMQRFAARLLNHRIGARRGPAAAAAALLPPVAKGWCWTAAQASVAALRRVPPSMRSPASNQSPPVHRKQLDIEQEVPVEVLECGVVQDKVQGPLTPQLGGLGALAVLEYL